MLQRKSTMPTAPYAASEAHPYSTRARAKKLAPEPEEPPKPAIDRLGEPNRIGGYRYPKPGKNPKKARSEMPDPRSAEEFGIRRTRDGEIMPPPWYEQYHDLYWNYWWENARPKHRGILRKESQVLKPLAKGEDPFDSKFGNLVFKQLDLDGLWDYIGVTRGSKYPVPRSMPMIIKWLVLHLMGDKMTIALIRDEPDKDDYDFDQLNKAKHRYEQRIRLLLDFIEQFEYKEDYHKGSVYPSLHDKAWKWICARFPLSMAEGREELLPDSVAYDADETDDERVEENVECDVVVPDTNGALAGTKGTTRQVIVKTIRLGHPPRLFGEYDDKTLAKYLKDLNYRKYGMV